MAQDLKKILQDFKAGNLTLEDTASKVQGVRVRYEIGAKRYAIMAYADTMTEKGWDTVKIRIIPNTTNIADIEKFIPDIKKRITETKKAEEEDKPQEEEE